MMKKFHTTTLAIACAVGSMVTANAAIVFTDDFETPDVDASQSTGNTSGAIDTAKWVKASDGFGSNRQGTVDESAGAFTDPDGEQAYAFRYTNSGITTQDGMIGAYGTGLWVTGAVITVTFDVVLDGHNDGLAFTAALGTFTAGDTVARNDANGGLGGFLTDGANSTLASFSGNAIAVGEPGAADYQQYSFTYAIDDLIEAGTATVGEDIVLRFWGATNTAIIDNVTVTAIPEPSTTALIGLGGLALILRRRK